MHCQCGEKQYLTWVEGFLRCSNCNLGPERDDEGNLKCDEEPLTQREASTMKLQELLLQGELSDIEISFPYKRPDPSDTIGRDRLDHIMNAITRQYYGFMLTTCPQCSNIHSFPVGEDSEEEFECRDCGFTISHDESPDLFF